MFLDFYKMREQPFGVTPDPRFLYLSHSHREALASLYYGIESHRGFVALIAHPGLGKTTLTFQLLEKLHQDSSTVFLFQTQCTTKELFHYLLNGLGVDAEGMELVSMHNKLNQILSREMLAGRRFVLAIDEAQNLDPHVLEAIRLLSNFETSRDKMLQILLIGQPQLARKLASPELEQLQQRISIFARLEPLGLEDTARYIAHRLRVAGYEGGPLFSPGALRLIAEHSQGIPRKINSLCFSALSLGCGMGRKLIDVAMMEEVIADRDVESFQQPKVAPRTDPLPAVLRPTLSPYPAKPRRSLGHWALGASSVIACIALGIGVLSLSPSRIDWLLQSPVEAWNSVRSTVAPFGGPTEGKPESGQVSTGLEVQAADFRSGASGKLSSSSEVEGIDTVIVQPGEKLRQILLRTMGAYNAETVEEIEKLNPAIVDFDHIEAGQSIRFPKVYAPAESAPIGAGPGAVGKNSGMSHPE
jgi:type II secretory pathway predicted ATPase ExeA